MRTYHLLVLTIVATTGCAARMNTRTAVYTCERGVVTPVHEAGKEPSLMVGSSVAKRTNSNGAGQSFVLVDNGNVLEYWLPNDQAEDALVYETSGQPRLVERCMVRGGHTDVLARWIDGQSLDEIGRELGIGDESDVRRHLRRAMRWMNKRSRQGDGGIGLRATPTIATR